MVFARGAKVRHIQLKTRSAAGAARSFPINIGLSLKPSAAVILILITEDLDTGSFVLGPFHCLGSPGMPLTLNAYPVHRHTKANAVGLKAERPNHRRVPLSAFTATFDSAPEVVEWLFSTRESR